MKTASISTDDLRGVFAVPPLARHNDGSRSLNFEENERIVKHIAGGGITRFLYGGNAFLYHITLAEFEQLLDWLSKLPKDLWVIPSIGPSFGRAMDQAALLRKYKFTCAMMLPCGDPRDAEGLARGMREVSETAGLPLIAYLKEEGNFGNDLEQGLDAVTRLMHDGVCAFIKYAVVRDDPRQDAYLEGLLKRVDRRRVISGIGERPAIVHMREWKLPGFTTGSGSIAPRLSEALYEACVGEDYEAAEQVRAQFLPLEDLRDAWGPAKVLHHATELAGVAEAGTIPPYLTALAQNQLDRIAPVARVLVERNMNG